MNHNRQYEREGDTRSNRRSRTGGGRNSRFQNDHDYDHDDRRFQSYGDDFDSNQGGIGRGYQASSQGQGRRPWNYESEQQRGNDFGVGSSQGSYRSQSNYGQGDQWEGIQFGRRDFSSSGQSGYGQSGYGSGSDYGYGDYGSQGASYGQQNSGLGSYGRQSGMGSQSTTGNWGSATQNRNFKGKGPKGFKRSDERIKEDVCQALEDDFTIDASDIEVEVENGTVTLSGNVEERYLKRLAEDLVESRPGVRDVTNQIKVSGKNNQGSSTSTSNRSFSSTQSKKSA